MKFDMYIKEHKEHAFQILDFENDKVQLKIGCSLNL